ncbi:MAG: hypothetical protein KAS32_09090 [Candidatus Peribacteraceae bacterium]|nr:hypothetical protein [Candidatus Peribacteraceae bacterium]
MKVNDKQKFLKEVEDFIEIQIEGEGDGEGWPIASNEELNKLRSIIYKLIDFKYQRDCDNDQGIVACVYNKKHSMCHFDPMPHNNSHRREGLSEKEKLKLKQYTISTANANLGVAKSYVESILRDETYTLSEKIKEIAE